MELELYAPIPDGYELVAVRAPKCREKYLSPHTGEVVESAGYFDKAEVRMIVRKIKPRIKRSFRVDVLDEPRRQLTLDEWGMGDGEVLVKYRAQSGRFSSYDYAPCIVTELLVENE